VNDHGGNYVVQVAGEEEDSGDDDGRLLWNSFSSVSVQMLLIRSMWSPYDIVWWQNGAYRLQTL